MKRIIYNVKHRNDEWHVVKKTFSAAEGHPATEGRFKSKPDAVDLARFLAMREEVGELRILSVDGSIQSEFLFGKDPYQIEG